MAKIKMRQNHRTRLLGKKRKLCNIRIHVLSVCALLTLKLGLFGIDLLMVNRWNDDLCLWPGYVWLPGKVAHKHRVVSLLLLLKNHFRIHSRVVTKGLILRASGIDHLRSETPGFCCPGKVVLQSPQSLVTRSRDYSKKMHADLSSWSRRHCFSSKVTPTLNKLEIMKYAGRPMLIMDDTWKVVNQNFLRSVTTFSNVHKKCHLF